MLGWIVLFLALPCIYASVSLAPWVPTRKKDIERLISILGISAEQRFLEVGSADARVCISLAKRFPQAIFRGVELAFPLFCLGVLRKIVSKVPNLTLRLGNALREDFGNYDIIYIFGMPEKLAFKILPKFLEEAKPGTRLISYVFSLPENQNYRLETFGESSQAKIHIATKL